MMQTTESWHCYDPATCTTLFLRFPSGRRAFSQREMRSIVLIIAGVFSHMALHMPFIKHDHMVEQIATAVANEALGHAVLPRTAEAGLLGLDAEAFDGADDFLVEIAATVKDWRSADIALLIRHQPA